MSRWRRANLISVRCWIACAFQKYFLKMTPSFILQEEPYIMARENDSDKVYRGNERYIGYCKDLADLVASKLNITCEYPG